MRQGPSKDLTSSGDKLNLPNAPTLAQVNLPTTPATPLSPAIREFIRFIVISADSKVVRRPDEVGYFRELKKDAETFSCFRECNKSYPRLVSSVRPSQSDHLFLARLLMWRLYAWRLPELQDLIENISSTQDVVEARQKVSMDHGAEAVHVKSYRRHYRASLPEDHDRIQLLWNHGVTIWSKWRTSILHIELNRARGVLQFDVYVT